MFQMVSLPFSLKIIWAPFVDTYYVKSFGRRKSWLVPIQLLCGVVMISVCGSLGDWLGTDSTDISGTSLLYRCNSTFTVNIYDVV